MPSLARLLGSSPARALEGEELEQRRSEHAEMTSGVNLAELAERKRTHGS